MTPREFFEGVSIGLVLSCPLWIQIFLGTP